VSFKVSAKARSRMANLLISTFTSVENGAALVGAPELLGMVEHLLSFALWTFLLYDGLGAQFVRIERLNR
jgi:hypothetical protein